MNQGDAEYRGPIRVTVGLSYAESWIREWCTRFCDVTFPVRSPQARGDADVRDDGPRAPPAPLEVLQRQAVLYGYQDPDPDHDYLGPSTAPVITS